MHIAHRSCLSEATVGGEPGCEVPFIAACSFILGTEHRWCEDPIESALFIIIIIIIIIFQT